MTDKIKHECGVAMIRLLKPLDYYYKKYGSWQYGLDKLYLLMEKQHNRGQEGAGLAAVKLEASAGNEFIFRERAAGSGAIAEIFGKIHETFRRFSSDKLKDIDFVKKSVPFAAELFLAHLRYSTTGKSGLAYLHPLLRRNNWASRSLALAGNFNMTNVDEMLPAQRRIQASFRSSALPDDERELPGPADGQLGGELRQHRSGALQEVLRGGRGAGLP